jgi:hypothetical protein
MAFTSKDGKSFGNRQQMKAYDERPAQSGAKKEPKAAAAHAEPDGDEGNEQDIQEVVAEHGPAEKIELHHDDAAGKHHVTSHHGGFTHKTVKAGREEAHEHARSAAGIQPEPPQDETDSAAHGEGTAPAIPGM